MSWLKSVMLLLSDPFTKSYLEDRHVHIIIM